ncbi:hypothetical protein SO802_035185 [Lithocarpus litseifolius]|uniref:HAT C-terminal dimerisation domain-containing protein n=1 Tax=Lithocarpus litseifolius TaxID=425828 RepID=A0AAW2BA83_9ROSI
MVDLLGEDLEVEEQEGTEEEVEQEATNEDVDTSRKRKTTSDVWEHFTRKKADGKFKAQCHHYGKLYLGESSQAILDPRYKMKLLEFYYPNIYGNNSNLEIEKIKNLCYDLLDEYEDVDESPIDNEGSSHMPAMLKRSEDFDILAWWKSNGLKYPTLQRIAKDILAIPVTTVTLEFAFSTSGRLLSPHHSRLHPKTINFVCSELVMERNQRLAID